MLSSWLVSAGLWLSLTLSTPVGIEDTRYYMGYRPTAYMDVSGGWTLSGDTFSLEPYVTYTVYSDGSKQVGLTVVLGANKEM